MTRYGVLLPPLLMALIQQVSAQDAATSQTPYPTWITNDYDCVIKCISDQLGSATPPATDDQKNAALGCIRDTCNQDTAAGNYYQAEYIIQMFDSIGSIYEPQSWQDGNAPDASDLQGPSGWVESPETTTSTDSNGQPQTLTTTAWVPPTADASGLKTDVADLPTGTASASATKLGVASKNGTSGNGTAGNHTEKSGAFAVVGTDVVGLSGLVGLVIAVGAGTVGGLGVLGL